MPRHSPEKQALVDEDRELVAAAARRVGNDRLRFTVADVRTEVASSRGRALTFPTELAKRVGELAKGVAAHAALLRELDGALALVVHVPPPSPRNRSAKPRARGGSDGPRVVSTYCLANRQHEFRALRPEALDELERVVLALAMATLKLGGAAAPTALVTTIMRTIPALTVTSTQQTNVLLSRLADREVPIAANVGKHGESARWTLVVELVELPLVGR